MPTTRYECTKCRHNKAETGELRTTGSGISRFLNLQNQKFGYAACASCGYTELYRLDGSGKLGGIFDVLTN